MIWGHLSWGVFWTWDARLTTTALLFVLFLGYLALRRMPAEPEVRAKRAAILGIVAFIDVPIVHQSVEWWRTLHQDATVLRRDLDVQVDGIMLFTLFLGFVVFTFIYAWLLLLPAATLLALFTHYPAVANLWHSFYSTPKANRPAKFRCAK